MNSGQNSTMFKIKRALKNKNTVTVISTLLVVIILLGGYKLRVDDAVRPVTVYFATETIQPRKQITDDLIGKKEIAAKAVEPGVITNINEIKNMYANYNTVIPKGSMFYRDVVVTKEELPDVALLDIPEGYIPYYLTVSMLTSYHNSMLPGNYIDIYVSTKDSSGQALVGKLISDVKIRAVKNADGLNVFENSAELRIPNAVHFAVTNEQFKLLKQIDAINGYGVGSTITVTLVPTTKGYGGNDEPIAPTVRSKYLENYIASLSKALPDEGGVDSNE